MDERERGAFSVTVVEASVEIEAPPERVWKIVSDVRHLPYWDRHITDVTRPRNGMRANAAFSVRLRFMAVRAEVDGEVLEWEPPWRSSIRLKGLLDATVTTTVASLPFERSMLRHEIDYRFRGPLGRFAARSLAALGGPRYALRRGIAAQKREIEAG